jgi:hypothetical protein
MVTPGPAAAGLSNELTLNMDASPALVTATTATATPTPAVTRPVYEIMQNPEVMVGVLAGLDTNATAQPVAANNLTLSFDLCAVSIDRDWWSWLLVRSPGWILPLWSAGQLVPGLPSPNSAVPPPCGLPSTMLLIKNLQISGWASTDLNALPQAARLGPFSFAGGKEIVSGSLRAPGMQVIGWVCDVLPSLPPADAGSGTSSGQ